MVYSKLENLKDYLKKDIYDKAVFFLNQVTEDMPEGEYPIDGDAVFARVMSYHTKTPENCKIEAHNNYIDIQASITGAEGIGVYCRDSLVEEEAYDGKKDVVFYNKKAATQIVHTVNIPGYFTMLFPEDAHSPQEQVLSFDTVKKFVIKVAVEQGE